MGCMGAEDPSSFGITHLGRLDHAGRAGDARAPEAAVAVGVLRKVALVVVLGEVELAGRHDLGGDAAVPGAAQRLLVALARLLCRPPLLVGPGEDRRAVLGADVVALPPAMGR